MAKVAFKQCEVERLLRAAKNVGYSHPAVEKRADGSLVLLTDGPTSEASSVPAGDDFDAELQAWDRKHGYG